METNIWNYEELSKAIHQTFDLVVRTENLIRVHQSVQDSPTIIAQYQELKQKYVQDLSELMQEMNISLKFTA